MMTKTWAATPWGIEAMPVEVEADIQNGLPGFQIVGLPDAAVRESRDRVRSAIRNSGFPIPPRVVTVNLAPADLRKEGNHLDLAIAVTLLAAFGEIDSEKLRGRMFCGELGLDGSLRPVRAALSIAALAARLQLEELIVPADTAPLAAVLGGVRVIAVDSLNSTLMHLSGHHRLAPSTPTVQAGAVGMEETNLYEVKGHAAAKRALEIAAAGAHNLLMIGPPGTGKTMLARCLPGLLPPLRREEAITVTKIHSVALERGLPHLIDRRPFRAPHTSVSLAGLVGGGSIPRPGEVSLAHAGVLFLDELPEFRRDALEALRQPLEEGHVSIVRARSRLTFPARFSLVAAMNPCPCGFFGDSRHDCRCSPQRRQAYSMRISGPLLDRIDLQVQIPRIPLSELKSNASENSSVVAQRVTEARAVQLNRQARDNAALTGDMAMRIASPEIGAQALLERSYERLGLSLRSLHRILKVGRTIADLDGCRQVATRHIAEAIQLRLTQNPDDPKK